MANRYPIKLDIDDLSSDHSPATWADYAARIEAHLNAEVASQTKRVNQFTYGLIAIKLGIPQEAVTELCGQINGGHTGCQIVRDDVAA